MNKLLLLIAATVGVSPSITFAQQNLRGVTIDNVTISYRDDISISAPADGMITMLDVSEGTTVNQDQLVLTLDTRLAESEKLVAEQEYKAAKEKAEDKSNKEFAEAKYEMAKLAFAMKEKLWKTGTAGKLEYNEQWLNRRQAELGVTVADVERKRDLAAMEIAIAKVNAADVQISLREMTAPVGGKVVEKRFQNAEYVRAGEEVLRIVNLEKLKAKFLLPAELLVGPAYRIEGADVVITVTVFRGTLNSEPQSIQIPAKVGFVSSVQENNGAYRAWAEFDNAMENGVPVIRQGMEASVTIDSPMLLDRRSIQPSAVGSRRP
jgi:multidrug efflux pump subunit AcrA (membrane-fusion protein)